MSALPNHGRSPYQSRLQAGMHQMPKQSPGARITTLICRANYPLMRSLVGFLVEECCMESCRPTDLPEEAV